MTGRKTCGGTSNVQVSGKGHPLWEGPRTEEAPADVAERKEPAGKREVF